MIAPVADPHALHPKLSHRLYRLILAGLGPVPCRTAESNAKRQARESLDDGEQRRDVKVFATKVVFPTGLADATPVDCKSLRDSQADWGGEEDTGLSVSQGKRCLLAPWIQSLSVCAACGNVHGLRVGFSRADRVGQRGGARKWTKEDAHGAQELKVHDPPPDLALRALYLHPLDREAPGSSGYAPRQGFSCGDAMATG